MISITSEDISLVKQSHQNRLIMLQVFNSEKKRVCNIQGNIISGSSDIDTESNIRRTASFSIKVDKASINNIIYLNMNYYIKVISGIESNHNLNTRWYNQGFFIINKNGFSFDEKTSTLNISLSDRMLDFTGDRKGRIHAYNSGIKKNQKIYDVMTNLVSEMGGIDDYDITPICPYRDSVYYWDENATNDDYNVPYDLEFSTGVTIYEMLEKLINLYPQWAMYFDVDGKFICEKEVLEEDDSPVLLDDNSLRGLVISENTDIEYSDVRNVVEVWGKDGKYYGEAKDETYDSPFSVSAIGELREVYSGGDYDNIYDVFYVDDYLMAYSPTAPQEFKSGEKYYNSNDKLIYTAIQDNVWSKTGSTPSNVAIYEYAGKYYRWNGTDMEVIVTPNNNEKAKLKTDGNKMAKEWAEYELYKSSRLKDKISLQLIFCPFINDVNFKIMYRSKIDDIERTYVVKKVSHNYSDNTTTLEMIRFYAENCTAYQSQLDTPVIKSIQANGMTVVVTYDTVPFAQQYNLYIDHKLSAISYGQTLTYTLPDGFEGEHIVYINASANGFRTSYNSENITLDFNSGDFIVTANGDIITTSNNKNIEFNKG